nr:disease resistance-like protein CSA1 [Ipomoea batatas]
MQRSSKKACNELLRYRWRSRPAGDQQPCDVFINHRGTDTRRNVAGMLYDRLRPFLDIKSMKPGDKLFEKIEAAVRGCRVGVAILSPQYCESYFCLHELALMVESKKRVIPVFCDVKPSELAVKDNIFRVYGDNKDMEKFRWALEEAKITVGITFDTMHGDWSELLARVTEAVMSNMVEPAMQRYSKKACNELLRYRRSFRPTGDRQPCDVFINHRGIDTKRNVAGMLYDRLRGHRLRPFLDSKSMKPGDKLFGKIEAAIRGCRVGVAILSPQYCESYFCLHELALMVESKKRVIPVFCDVKPSELAVKDNIFRVYGDNKDMEKFRWALEEAKFTVGITFDTVHG